MPPVPFGSLIFDRLVATRAEIRDEEFARMDVQDELAFRVEDRLADLAEVSDEDESDDEFTELFERRDRLNTELIVIDRRIRYLRKLDNQLCGLLDVHPDTGPSEIEKKHPGLLDYVSRRECYDALGGLALGIFWDELRDIVEAVRSDYFDWEQYPL